MTLLWALLAAFAVGPTLVATHSTRAPPLQRLHAVEGPSLRVLRRDADHVTRRALARRSDGFNATMLRQPPPSPERTQADVRHDDTLLVRFVVNAQPVSLVLSPTPDLIHPDARVHYHTLVNPTTGETSVTTEAIRREDVRAYSGHVVRESFVERWWAETMAGLVRTGSADDDMFGWTAGWARMALRPQDGAWDGAFTLDGRVYHVKPIDSYLRTRLPNDPLPDTRHYARPSVQPGAQTIVFADVDLIDEHALDMAPIGCHHDDLSFNADALESARLPLSVSAASSSPLDWASIGGLVRRQTGGDVAGGGNQSRTFSDSIGNTAGCPKERRVVFMGVAADCTYTSHYGNQSAATTQILNNVNSASALYQSSFNVSLGVVELNVQDAACPSSAPSANPWNVGCPEGGPSGLDLNTRLSVFSQWRGNKGGADGAGLWHLMTNCSSGSEVGVAWLGQVCQVSAQGSSGDVTSGTGVTSQSRNEWQVMAHEIGHSFGAIHDCVNGCPGGSTCCPLSTTSCNSENSFIMSPVSTKSVSAFSPCSLGNVCTLINGGLNTSCLLAPGQRSVISLQQCGNGIVEPGEDCDPGGATSACCNPTTCKYATGAVCDPSNSACCTSSCRLASSTQVCRPAVDSRCDTAETCSGTSATCPSDGHIADGTSCASGLACAGGICTSRDLQCQTQGASLGLKSACSLRTDSSCAVTCASPSSSSSCVVLDSNFVDGSPCGFSGTCSNGACNEGSALDVAKGWYRQNLQISIPVTIVCALLILALLWALIRCCVRKARANRTPPSAAYANRPHRRSRSANPSIVQPPMAAVAGSPVRSRPQHSAPLDPAYRNSDSSHRNLLYPPPGSGPPSGQSSPRRTTPPHGPSLSPEYARYNPPAFPPPPQRTAGYGTSNDAAMAAGLAAARSPGAASQSSPAHWVDQSAWNGPARSS